METRSSSLDASSQVALPHVLWQDFTARAGELCSHFFPQGEVAVRVVTANEIRRLNRLYRGVDAETDVLSFPAHDFPAPLGRAGAATLRGHIGDVALCWEAARLQAGQNGNSEIAEAVALLAHALLHLAGFDHRTDAEQAVMDDLTIDLCRAVRIEVERFGH